MSGRVANGRHNRGGRFAAPAPAAASDAPAFQCRLLPLQRSVPPEDCRAGSLSRNARFMQAAGVRFHQKQDVEKDCLFKKITSPKQAIKNGIGFLTEDRRGEGLVLEMDILNNLNLPILDKMTTPIVNFLHKRQMRENTAEAFERFHIVAHSAKQKVRQLSSGNQQKVVLGKWFLTDPDIFILDEPARGVDIKVKAEIYEQIVTLAKAGRAVLVISSEAPELLGICHRILVMRNGKIEGEYLRGEATEEKLVKSAMGGDRVC